jgi:hypothetical protein
VSVYGYYIWQIFEPLQLTAGLSYDRLTFPVNSEVAPISGDDEDKDRVSPKVGVLYTPWKNGALRGVYTRSLGGVFYDQSVRLEPTQIAGFNQAFRSIIPESVAGLVPGSKFETWGAAFDQKFDTGTYLGITGEILNSDADRTVGAFDFIGVPPAVPGGTRERLNYEEKSLTVTLNQLVSKEWSLGASYRISQANAHDQFLDIPASVSPAADRNLSATLQQLNLYALYNLPCGFFAQFSSVWSSQSNQGYSPDIPGDDFWQFNVFAGYRFLRRQAEVRVGLLNIGDQDYRLNPLTLYSELPHERTLMVSFKFYF